MDNFVIRNKDILYSTRKYSHYFVITLSGVHSIKILNHCWAHAEKCRWEWRWGRRQKGSNNPQASHSVFSVVLAQLPIDNK